MGNRSLKVIGVSGTNGAGKDSMGLILERYYNYLFISVTELLRAEAKRRNLAIERSVLRTISAEWRRQLGLGVLVDKAVSEFDVKKAYYHGVVMASLRNSGEADRIHELGGSMVWIDADPEIRYHRVQANKELRARHEEDQKTFDEFMAEEAAEMQSHGGDAATLDMAKVKQKCDFFIDNSSENLEDFREHIEKTLNLKPF